MFITPSGITKFTIFDDQFIISQNNQKIWRFDAFSRKERGLAFSVFVKKQFKPNLFDDAQEKTYWAISVQVFPIHNFYKNFNDIDYFNRVPFLLTKFFALKKEPPKILNFNENLIEISMDYNSDEFEKFNQMHKDDIFVTIFEDANLLFEFFKKTAYPYSI